MLPNGDQLLADNERLVLASAVKFAPGALEKLTCTAPLASLAGLFKTIGVDVPVPGS